VYQLDLVGLFPNHQHGKKPMIMPKNRLINVKNTQMNDDIFIIIYISSFLAGADDTVDAELKRVTFEPKLITVAEELMQVNGIVETRKRGPVYIY